jgi:hypothetical protein
MELLAQDIATVRGRDIILREVWDMLVQAGIVNGSEPPPPKPKRKKPELRIVSQGKWMNFIRNATNDGCDEPC